jgi:hypothetical protein
MEGMMKHILSKNTTFNQRSPSRNNVSSDVDAIKRIEYSDSDRGYGFIQGYRNIGIFFHISVMKRANLPNFVQLLELLENEKYASFPIMWFVTDENERGLYVKEFLHKEKFDSRYRNDFISEFGNSIKNDVINGKEIDNRTELLLSELFGTEDYNQIIRSRYEDNNSRVTKWNLGFLPPNKDKQRQSLRQYRIGDYLRGPIFDFEISEFINNKILELTNENQLTPVFFKLGTTVSGSSVVTDVQSYDPLEIPDNSDGNQIKDLIEYRLTQPPVSAETIDFWKDYYDVLFTQSEKDAIQNKKEQLFQEYLKEQERIRIKKEEAEEQARIAKEEQQLKEAEYKALLEEVRPLGFTKSSQVSKYIIDNNLEQKYGLISGDIQMENDFYTWNFDGGIDPEYYKRLCIELGLENNNSGSSVRDFSPYRKK